MAHCAYCNAETELYYSEVPICMACSEQREQQKRPAELESQLRAQLMQDLLKTSQRAKNASESFLNLLKDGPSGLPHPDGALRIQKASHELTIARQEMEQAHSRLNLYLSRGILLENRKRAVEE
jgi:hypothetical protein